MASLHLVNSLCYDVTHKIFVYAVLNLQIKMLYRVCTSDADPNSSIDKISIFSYCYTVTDILCLSVICLVFVYKAVTFSTFMTGKILEMSQNSGFRANSIIKMFWNFAYTFALYCRFSSRICLCLRCKYDVLMIVSGTFAFRVARNISLSGNCS